MNGKMFPGWEGRGAECSDQSNPFLLVLLYCLQKMRVIRKKIERGCEGKSTRKSRVGVVED